MPDAALNAHAAVSVIPVVLRVVSISPHLKIEMWGTRHPAPGALLLVESGKVHVAGWERKNRARTVCRVR